MIGVVVAVDAVRASEVRHLMIKGVEAQGPAKSGQQNPAALVDNGVDRGAAKVSLGVPRRMTGFGCTPERHEDKLLDFVVRDNVGGDCRSGCHARRVVVMDERGKSDEREHDAGTGDRGI